MAKSFDIGYLFTSIPLLLKALPMTLYIMAASMVAASAVAMLITAMRLREKGFFKNLATVYVSFIRGTPSLVQLFLIYFGMPQLLNTAGVDISSWPKTTFIILAFTLNIAAYLSEIMRAAYLSVDKGQHEAALTIGMNGFQKFYRIILPQAFVVALPNVGNTMISLLKETSLAFTIGIVDLMGQVKNVGSRTYGARQLELYIAVAFIYWLVCFIMGKGIVFMEKNFTLTRPSAKSLKKGAIK